jgi:hypothetical protein
MLIGCLGGNCPGHEGCAHYQYGSMSNFVERYCTGEAKPVSAKEYEDKPTCGKEPEVMPCETVTG